MTQRPASPAQLRFIRDLLTARPEVLAQYGVATVEAATEALAANAAFDTKAASGMIDQLKGIPAAAPAALVGAPAGAKPNRYAGKCHNCKGTVAEMAGYFTRSGAGKVLVFHTTCPTPAAQPAAPQVPAVTVNDGDLYVNDQGTVRRVYTTQNGNLAVKKLTVHTHGNGSMRFEAGGMTILKADIAAGTAHIMSQQEAAAFGEQYGVCSNCGLDINDDRSIAAGYGPVCAANHNWFYPSYEQAATILGRPVTRPSGAIVLPLGTGTQSGAPLAVAALTTPLVPTCEACGEAIADVAGEPCLQGTPDYRGIYPTHPAA